jgi:MATE family multidrug resistance protein
MLVWSPWAIGPEGSPLALAISYFLLMIFLMLYVKYREGGDAYGGWEWNEALNWQKIWVFVKLGIPGILMTGTEWYTSTFFFGNFVYYYICSVTFCFYKTI